MNIPARTFTFLLALLTSTFLLLTFATSTHAQQPVDQPPPQQTNPYLNTNTNPDVPQNMNTWTQNIMINLMASGVCQLVGINPATPDQRCLGVDPTTGKIGFVEQKEGQVGGALGVTTNLIAATFTHPPASSREYVAYMGGKFGIVESAYAQTGGTGFAGLSPLMRIWEAFRNIAYLAFVIVFVIIGLMIMLRVKIDPRTVMTIQNSIPRVIIGLILVTFSFALAGFFIDMMYVVIFLFFGLFAGIDINSTFSTGVTNLQQQFQSQNAIGAFNSLFAPNAPGVPPGTQGVIDMAQKVAGAFGDSLAIGMGGQAGTQLNAIPLIAGLIGGLLLGIFTAGVSIPVGVAAGAVFGGAVSAGSNYQGAISGVASIIAFLIFFIAILWALFRLLMVLIQSYIWILIDVVFAPLWILGGTFPGSPASFSQWLRDIISHLSVYPTTIFMFLLGKAFIEGFGAAAGSGSAFVPPLIGAQSVEVVKAFIGLGIIFLLPQVLTMVKDAFKAPKFPYGAAIGQAVGVGTGAPGGVVGRGAQFGSTLFGLSYLPGVGSLPFLQKIKERGHSPTSGGS